MVFVNKLVLEVSTLLKMMVFDKVHGSFGSKCIQLQIAYISSPFATIHVSAQDVRFGFPQQLTRAQMNI